MKRLRLWVAMTAIAIGMTASSARADFALRFHEAGHSDVTVHWSDVGQGTFDAQGNEKITYSATFGDFAIELSVARSNTPGTNNLAKLTIATATITNLDGSGHTLTVSTSADYTKPTFPLPLTLKSTASGTLDAGSVSGDFTSYVTSGSTLFDTSGTPSPAVTFNKTGNNLSFGGDAPNTLVYSLSTPFVLTNVGNYTLGGGSDVVLTGGGTNLVPAPEPSTFIAAVSALPVFGLAGWLRRRKAGV